MFYEMTAEIAPARISVSVALKNAWTQWRYRNYEIVSEAML